MHLNCLHDKWKSSFIIWEEKQKKKVSKNIHTLTTLTHTFPLTHTSTLSLTHSQVTKHHKQTLYETSDEHKLLCLTIKLHTVQPHERISSLSQWMASTREEKKKKNHVKEHLLWSSSRVSKSPPAGRSSSWNFKEKPKKKNPLILWFFVFFTAARSWISGCWELSLKAKTRAASSFFFLRWEILSQHCYSQFDRRAAASRGAATESTCAQSGKKYFRPHVWNECCGFLLEQ